MELIGKYVQSTVVFNDTRTHRYELRRIWDMTLPVWMYLMLNPSTADEVKNDPTIERCERRARFAGAGGMLIGNLFGLRSTDPKALYTHLDPIGAENNDSIISMARDAERVICGWGVHGAHLNRDVAVSKLLRDAGFGQKIQALAVTKHGAPAHPLYLSYTLEPQLYRLPVLVTKTRPVPTPDTAE